MLSEKFKQNALKKLDNMSVKDYISVFNKIGSKSGNIDNTEDVILKLNEKLNDIAKLEDNWNGYGANQFKPELINRAKTLLKLLSNLPEVFCTGRDSIQFEWEDENHYLELEIFEDKITVFETQK